MTSTTTPLASFSLSGGPTVQIFTVEAVGPDGACFAVLRDGELLKTSDGLAIFPAALPAMALAMECTGWLHHFTAPEV